MFSLHLSHGLMEGQSNHEKGKREREVCERPNVNDRRRKEGKRSKEPKCSMARFNNGKYLPIFPRARDKCFDANLPDLKLQREIRKNCFTTQRTLSTTACRSLEKAYSGSLFFLVSVFFHRFTLSHRWIDVFFSYLFFY